jgi:hypothetical protein
MKAFTGTPITKEELITELKWHQEQDNFVRGRYFEDGKGCAVGCSLESLARKKGIKLDYGDHTEYESKFGVPQWLARVEDRLFEGMGAERAKQWPVEFMEAVNVGSDLNKIKLPFLKVIVSSVLEYIPEDKYEGLRNSVRELETLLASSEENKSKYLEVREKIHRGRRAASYAASYAAYAASASAAAYVSSAAYAAASAAYGAARTAKYEFFADELLKLIRNCQ